MNCITHSSKAVPVVIALICVLQATTGHAASGLKRKPAQPAGGANQVSGTNGKLGQMLFTGYWRFEALAVHTDLATYTLTVPSAEQNAGAFRDVATFNRVDDPTPHTFIPRAGYVLVAVDCLVKNGQTSVQSLDCFTPNNTSVTDDQGQSYQAIGYDMLTDGPATTKPMLQGSSEKMTVLFAVPPGTKLKDMVFTLMSMGHSATKKDVRISLSQPAAS